MLYPLRHCSVPVPCENGSTETTVAEGGRNLVAGLWGRTLRWELTTWADFQLRLHRLLMSVGQTVCQQTHWALTVKPLLLQIVCLSIFWSITQFSLQIRPISNFSWPPLSEHIPTEQARRRLKWRWQQSLNIFQWHHSTHLSAAVSVSFGSWQTWRQTSARVKTTRVYHLLTTGQSAHPERSTSQTLHCNLVIVSK